ncbi:MAG: noncanonical pyrimidine nucleotidase, YjjG family [Anaerolineae bacterium]|nr:noncanonical pyrimidine nucleotidase, YjjG family [Anaerolineae bacterium]
MSQPMSRYTWLLFDADGTLFDYDAAEIGAIAQTFTVHGLRYELAYGEQYRHINHQFWQRFERQEVTLAELRVGRFQELFLRLGMEVDLELFAQNYLEQLAAQSQLFAGAAALIEQLHGRYRLALITNGLAVVQYPRLERSGLRPYFAAVIVSDEVGVGKPDPAIFDVAFAQMGYPAKENVLIVGDGLTSDMQGGISYGIDTCWLNLNGKTANGLPITYEIHQLSDLTKTSLEINRGVRGERREKRKNPHHLRPTASYFLMKLNLSKQRLNYDAIAHLYDEPLRDHVVDEHLIQFGKAHCSAVPGHILDMGCGTGKRL